MNPNKHLTVGTTLKFTKHYEKKVSRRFGLLEGTTNKYVLMPSVPDGNYSGNLVGIRSVIMEDYDVKQCGVDFESGQKEGPNWAEGKKEQVYLVIFSLYMNPVIVRKCDIIP